MAKCTSTPAFTFALLLMNNGTMPSSWRLVPKQDHLTCFLAGSLMLGAVTAEPRVPRNKISRPPSPEQLSEEGLRDWKAGSELLKTCLHTHDTATYVLLFCILRDGGLKLTLTAGDWLGGYHLRLYTLELRVMG